MLRPAGPDASRNAAAGGGMLPSSNGEAGASGWVVTYTSGGDTKKLEFSLAIRLCNEEGWAKSCQALKA